MTCPPVTHELKCIDPFYDEVEAERKVHELRKDDRSYQAGDTLHLRHYDAATDTYSGRSVRRKVTYVMRGPWPLLEDTRPAKTPCIKCGQLPRPDGLTRLMCPTHLCVRGSFIHDQWGRMNYAPALAKGWCIMSLAPIPSLYESTVGNPS